MLDIFHFDTHSLRFKKASPPHRFLLLLMFYNPVYDNLKQHSDITCHSKFTTYCCHLLVSVRCVTVARRHFENTTKWETSCKSSGTRRGKQASPSDAAPFASYFYVNKTSSCFTFPTQAHSAKKEFPENSRKTEEGGFKPILNLHNGCKALARFYLYEGKLGDSK